jgi:hypothetical protein
MSSRAINIGCARAIMSRHSALVMWFCMRLGKNVCHAMSRGLLLPEYFDCLLVSWRVRATYATDTDNLQTKGRVVGVFVLHTQLTTTFICQSLHSCMNL